MTRPPIHPGEILVNELSEIGIDPNELARQLNMPPSRIGRILNSRQAIKGDTASASVIGSAIQRSSG